MCSQVEILCTLLSTSNSNCETYPLEKCSMMSVYSLLQESLRPGLPAIWLSGALPELGNFRFVPTALHRIPARTLFSYQTSLHRCKSCLAAVAHEIETLAFRRIVFIFLLCMNSVFLSCRPALRNLLLTQRNVEMVSVIIQQDLYNARVSASRTLPQCVYSDSRHGLCL